MRRKQSKSERTKTRANRSIYTKLGAFAQLRLSRGQETEVIRKSVLPFSILVGLSRCVLKPDLAKHILYSAEYGIDDNRCSYHINGVMHMLDKQQANYHNSTCKR